MEILTTFLLHKTKQRSWIIFLTYLKVIKAIKSIIYVNGLIKYRKKRKEELKKKEKNKWKKSG